MFQRRIYRIPYMKRPYTEEMIEAAVKELKKGHLTVHHEGEQFIPFEQEFARYCGKKYAISLSSGTASLHLAILASGVKEGDEVIIPANTTLPVAEVVEVAGAKPVFVDPEYDTMNIDPTKIEEKITDKTKAMMVVHSYGHAADMDPIMEIAEKHSIQIIDNPTHSLGGRYNGNKLPRANLGIFAFHGTKSLWLSDGSGGGVVVTDDADMAEEVKLRRYHGFDLSSGSYQSLILGYNYRLSDIAAAIGRIQLRDIDEYTKNQRENAARYTELLEDVPVTTPVEKDYTTHSFVRYVIFAPKRDQLQTYLNNQGIGTAINYSVPMHLQKRFMELYGYRKGDFPVTEKIKEVTLCLPAPYLRETWEIEYVTDKIKEFYAAN